MHRRNIFHAAIAAFGALVASSRVQAAGDDAPDRGLKVVYHLNEIDKVGFVLGNVQNHYDGVGGPEHVTIALVVHGPALRAFTSGAAQDVRTRVAHFSKAGLELAACGNTMKAQNITLKDLLPGFVAAEKGGVVRLAELQSEGYLYLRP